MFFNIYKNIFNIYEWGLYRGGSEICVEISFTFYR